jgi:hypothetical protein
MPGMKMKHRSGDDWKHMYRVQVVAETPGSEFAPYPASVIRFETVVDTVKEARMIASATMKQKDGCPDKKVDKMHRPGIEPGAGRIVHDH